MNQLTEKEIKWLEQGKKERFFIGNVFEAMNKRAREYSDLGKDFAWRQTLQDFQGLYAPSEIEKNDQWDIKDYLSFAFVEVPH